MDCITCKNIITYKIERYPRMLCINCINSTNIKDLDGNNVYFENEDFSGGFISIHTIDNKQVIKKDHYCLINGIRCYADEARFGGIVIQAL